MPSSNPEGEAAFASEVAEADTPSEPSSGDSPPSSQASEEPGGISDDDASVSEVESARQSPLPLDVVFDVLKNDRRRLVLQYLRDVDGQSATIGELAEFIAAEENDKSIDELRSNERKRVYVGLYQCHLPKMADAGVVVSDRNIDVTLGPNAEYAFEYLDVEASGADRDWHRIYIGLFAAGLALYAGYLFGPVSLAGAFATALGGVFLLFGGVAIGHAIDEEWLFFDGQ